MPVLGMETIGISRVLDEINTPLDEGQARVFTIGWIRKSGKVRGTYKECTARKWSDRPNGIPKPAKGLKGDFSLKENKTLLIENIRELRAHYVGIETIITYNGYRVRH